MIDLWRMSTKVGQAIMGQVLLSVRILVVSGRAMALVVVDQIFTGTGLASTLRAVRNVIAKVNAFISDVLSETAVAVAREVINVLSCGIGIVCASAVRRSVAVDVRSAHVFRRCAVVDIDALRWVVQLAV
jgi:hypothetical protein